VRGGDGDGDGEGRVMGSSYDDWTVHQLKWALKERDLPVSGKKRVLIERLTSDDADVKHGNGEEGVRQKQFEDGLNMSDFSDFRAEVSFPFSRKWIPLFFSDPKTTLLKRILITITLFLGIVFLVVVEIYFFLFLGTFFWDFEIELFGFRGLKLLGILFIPYAVFFGLSLIIGASALKDVFIKITRKEAEQSIMELKDIIDRLKSKGIDTTDLERVLAECEAEMDFQKADKLARQAVTEANELESQYQAAAERVTELRAKIVEFKEKGINTDELERVLAECEE
jgi:hypothetical protein